MQLSSSLGLQVVEDGRVRLRLGLQRRQTSPFARKLVLVAMCKGLSQKTTMWESTFTAQRLVEWIERAFAVQRPRIVFTKVALTSITRRPAAFAIAHGLIGCL
jgi:hypothetical protein